MPVLRSILHGFGFTVGARAATEVLDELAKDDAPPPSIDVAPPSSRDQERVRVARAKAAKKRERDVDRELSAMKKRLRREG